jgi:hypothetical protein
MGCDFQVNRFCMRMLDQNSLIYATDFFFIKDNDARPGLSLLTQHSYILCIRKLGQNNSKKLYHMFLVKWNAMSKQ